MEESRLEHRLKREIKERGGKALKFTSPGEAGMPDRIVLLPGGRAVFVEMKAPSKAPRSLQRKRAEELKAMGFSVYCLDSVAAINNFIMEVFGS
jgi:Holliday junction resolvase